MHLLTRIQVHLRRTGMPPTTFGRMVVHDPRFVEDLRNGRQPGARMEARVHAWLDEQDAERKGGEQ